MPGASFHSFYWQQDSQPVPDVPLGSSAGGGYIPWMTTVTVINSLLLIARVSWAMCR